MSGCCGKYDCKRKRPYVVYLGPSSGRVYLSTQGKEVADGVYDVVAPHHDITDTVEKFVRMNPDWVMDALFGPGL